MKKIILVFIILGILIINGCAVQKCGNSYCEKEENYVSCPEDCPKCDDDNKCTNDFFDYQIQECKFIDITPCLGNKICELGEYPSDDCPDCNDNNTCTEDSFDFITKKCKNIIITPCCGNGLIEEDEYFFNCPADVPCAGKNLGHLPNFDGSCLIEGPKIILPNSKFIQLYFDRNIPAIQTTYLNNELEKHSKYLYENFYEPKKDIYILFSFSDIDKRGLFGAFSLMKSKFENESYLIAVMGPIDKKRKEASSTLLHELVHVFQYSIFDFLKINIHRFYVEGTAGFFQQHIGWSLNDPTRINWYYQQGMDFMHKLNSPLAYYFETGKNTFERSYEFKWFWEQLYRKDPLVFKKFNNILAKYNNNFSIDETTILDELGNSLEEIYIDNQKFKDYIKILVPNPEYYLIRNDFSENFDIEIKSDFPNFNYNPNNLSIKIYHYNFSYEFKNKYSIPYELNILDDLDSVKIHIKSFDSSLDKNLICERGSCSILLEKRPLSGELDITFVVDNEEKIFHRYWATDILVLDKQGNLINGKIRLKPAKESTDKNYYEFDLKDGQAFLNNIPLDIRDVEIITNSNIYNFYSVLVPSTYAVLII